MTTSLILSTYNWPDALKLSLKSIQCLSMLPDELIIADDGSTEDTKILIDDFREKYTGKIIHIWHQDKGFKLAEIRNKAIKAATGDYIIQIDGDVILNKNFILDHTRFAKKGSFIKGRRVMIGKRKSEELLQKQSSVINYYCADLTRREHGFRISFFNDIFKPKEISSSDGVTGSNMAFWREDFINVNGYNNELKGWGAEDKELAQRFVNIGLVKRKIRFAAIQYHIYHIENNKNNHEAQMQVIEDLRSSRETQCLNGLNEIGNDYIIYD